MEGFTWVCISLQSRCTRAHTGVCNVTGVFRGTFGIKKCLDACLWTLTVPCLEEKIMSKEKHLSKYLFQMEAVVFIVLQIFFVTHGLKIGEYHSDIPQF